MKMLILIFLLLIIILISGCASRNVINEINDQPEPNLIKCSDGTYKNNYAECEKIVEPAPEQKPDLLYEEDSRENLNLTPMFFKNPVWELPIKYYINTENAETIPTFIPSFPNTTRLALKLWENLSGNRIKLEEVFDSDKANVIIYFDKYKAGEYDTVISGEGGPTQAYNLGGHVLLKKGVMFVVPTGYYDCLAEQTVLHEFGHVLGLGHSDNQSSIMWAYGGHCFRKITPETVQTIINIYDRYYPPE